MAQPYAGEQRGAPTPAAAIEMVGITKRFGPVVANDGVGLSLLPGEVHALVGENGAGKSTLMNILYGLHHPDEGVIRVNGHAVTITSPQTAIAHGIGMVHQHFMLAPQLTVAQNITLGREPRRGLLLDHRKASEAVRELGQRHGLPVDPDVRIQGLPVGLQQRVEILKLLYRGADVLILDEPTAVLIPQEVGELLQVLRLLAREGKAVVLITHKLDEVMAVADRVTVLRGGRKVGTVVKQETTAVDLARMMVGRSVLFDEVTAGKAVGQEFLTVRGISAKDNRGLPALRDVSFSVRAGEILGIAGVSGNGQTELVECLAGLRPYSGEVLIGGQTVSGMGPRALRKLGVAHIPEDRSRTGLAVSASAAENLIAGRHHQAPLSKRGRLDAKAILAYAQELIRKFQVKIPAASEAVRTLSGGNMQKVVVARELSTQPKLALVAQPTRGVDIGAIQFIHDVLLEQRDAGTAVLLVSTELDEILRLADRILVLYQGRVQGELPRSAATPEHVGILMGGGSLSERSVARD